MKIGDIARTTGLSTSAIRFYEDKGLLSPAGRGSSGYRVYDARDIDRLRLIGLAKSLGFSLDQIRSVLTEDDGLSKPDVLRSLDARVEEIARMQAALDVQRTQLAALKATLEAGWSKGACVAMDECVSPGLVAAGRS